MGEKGSGSSCQSRSQPSRREEARAHELERARKAAAKERSLGSHSRSFPRRRKRRSGRSTKRCTQSRAARLLVTIFTRENCCNAARSTVGSSQPTLLSYPTRFRQR